MPPTIPCREVNSLTISVARSTLSRRAAVTAASFSASQPSRSQIEAASAARRSALSAARPRPRWRGARRARAGVARRLLLRFPAQPVADRGGERGQALGLLGVAAELLLEGQPLELLRPVREAGLAVLAVEEAGGCEARRGHPLVAGARPPLGVVRAVHHGHEGGPPLAR